MRPAGVRARQGQGSGSAGVPASPSAGESGVPARPHRATAGAAYSGAHLQPGDLLLLDNHVVLHARSPYEDFGAHGSRPTRCRPPPAPAHGRSGLRPSVTARPLRLPTYQQFDEASARLAGLCTTGGVRPGDVVTMTMRTVPLALLLAAQRLDGVVDTGCARGAEEGRP
ncbi:hypothetical protein ABT187_15790 [Streptomyces sp. NPDC001817]|uniref:hypothetical protein n=1 Tax=Streptomyces sp. NPDC001817 TaxID=3154398 RepID=UPI003331DA3F